MTQAIESFRPSLRRGLVLRPSADGTAVLKDCENGVYLLLGVDEAAITREIDGRRTLEELAQLSYERNHKFSISKFLNLVNRLSASGFLANPQSELDAIGLEGPKEQRGIKGFSRLLARMASIGLYNKSSSRVMGALCHPLLAPILLAALLILAMYWLLAFDRAAASAVMSSYTLKAVEFIIALSLALSLRSIMVGSAIRAMGGEIWAGGIALFVAVPYLSVDARDAQVAGPRGRALSALFGIASLAALLLTAVAGAKAHAGLFGSFMGTLAIVSATALFLDLSPVLPSDLNELADAVDPNPQWRERAASYLRKKWIIRLFSFKLFPGEQSLFLFGTYAIVWLLVGALAAAGILRRYGMEWLSALQQEQGLDLLAVWTALILLVLASLALIVAFLGALLKVIFSPISEPWRRLAQRPKVRKEVSASGLDNITAELAAVPLFSALSSDEVNQLAGKVKVESYSAGDYIIRQGDKGDKFYSIRSGKVKVVVEDQTGVQNKVAELGSGNSFGEIALLEGVPRTAHVVAMEKVELFSLSREVFQDFAQGQGLTAQKVTDLLRFTQFLGNVELFGGMPGAGLVKLAGKLKPRQMIQGEEIIRQGEHGDEFYLIRRGRIMVIVEKHHVPEPVAELGPGQYFGEIALLRNVPRTATCKCTDSGELLVLSREDFIGILGSNFNVAAQLEHASELRLQQDAKVG